MEFQFGKNAVIYHSSSLFSAISGTGSFFDATIQSAAVEFDKVRDVTLDLSPETVDPTTRALAKTGWKSEVPVIRSGNVTFTMNWIDGHTIENAIRDSFLNLTEIAFAVLSQDKGIVGAQGLAANFIASFSRNEPISDVITADVTLNLSSFPHWFEMT